MWCTLAVGRCTQRHAKPNPHPHPHPNPNPNQESDMASLKAEGIDTLVPALVWVARVASPRTATAARPPPHAAGAARQLASSSAHVLPRRSWST